LRVRGKGGRNIWRFNFGHSLSIKIMEVEGRTLEALSAIFEAIFRGFDQNF